MENLTLRPRCWRLLQQDSLRRWHGYRAWWRPGVARAVAAGRPPARGPLRCACCAGGLHNSMCAMNCSPKQQSQHVAGAALPYAVEGLTYALEEPRCDQQAQEQHACHDGIPCGIRTPLWSTACVESLQQQHVLLETCAGTACRPTAPRHAHRQHPPWLARSHPSPRRALAAPPTLHRCPACLLLPCCRQQLPLQGGSQRQQPCQASCR